MRKFWTVGIVSVAFALLAAPTKGSAAAEQKFGVVDIQGVLDTVQEGKTAKADWEKYMKGKKDEFEKKNAELEKLAADFEKQKAVLSDAKVQERGKELQTKQIAFQQQYLAVQKEMQAKEMTLMGGILKKIRSIVDEMGSKQGYDFIFEKGNVVYVKNAFDLTDQVVKAYDKAYAAKK